jgi:hypothetical protein
MYENVKLANLKKVAGRISNGYDGAIPVMNDDEQLFSICYIDKKNGIAYDLLSNDIYYTFIKGEVVNQINLASLNIGDYVVTELKNYDLKHSKSRMGEEIRRKYIISQLKIALDKLNKISNKKFVKHI